MEDKSRCFIITPIGDDSDPIRRHIDGIIEAAIKPALENKYDLVVAHKISEPGSITKQIIKEIYSAKLVIANLTNRNPNVMYELAFRHSLGKPVIMIAEKGTPLPSDIIMQRTIFYQNDAQGVLDLRAQIRDAENHIDFEKENSPIYDVIHEYSRDAQIIKISQDQLSDSIDGENANTLRYILQKLNNLEDALHAIRPIDSGADDSTFLIALFTFEDVSRPYDKKELLLKLQGISNLEPSIQVQDLRIDEGNKHCFVLIHMQNKYPLYLIYDYIKNVLHSYGFVKVSLLGNSLNHDPNI